MQKQPLEVFYKKVIVKNISKFTGKHQCWSLILNKNAGCNVIKKVFNTGVFLWILRNFKNTFFTKQFRVTAPSNGVTRNSFGKKLHQLPRKLPLMEYYLNNIAHWKLSDGCPTRNFEHFSEQLFCMAPLNNCFL